MPRGRPKAQPKVDYDDPLMGVAEMLAQRCGIPGCSAKNHLEEAREIANKLSSKGTSNS